MAIPAPGAPPRRSKEKAATAAFSEGKQRALVPASSTQPNRVNRATAHWSEIWT
jgi:hypothetical protein